ncbi:hypothetical protein [Listeria booriae]|uniref:Uncharacterized protein n=1 Tax=Listeria booriae TaxID=1552123 RepID=A0A841ZWC9_9LIST|nr:hypothetical protein [Listeria booriae]MBC1565059.1 hypothetical protein [Listeria booriae]
MERWVSLDERMKSLGFLVGIASTLYVLDLNRNAMLIVEGERVKGFSERRFSFYKMIYANGKRVHLKVYRERVSASDMFVKVNSFMEYIKKKG